MSDYIPLEIWSSIFRKCSPETLIKCLSVCKPWKTLISSPSFIASHIAIQKPILITSDSNVLHQIDLQTYLPVRLSTFDFLTKPDPRSSFRFIGTVNGIICLLDHFAGVKNTILLCNPLIRRCVYLPEPIYSSSGMVYGSVLAFGSGSGSESELKIVRIALVNRVGLSGQSRPLLPQAEVFSVREHKWRSIQYDSVNCSPFGTQWSQGVLNRAAHWSVYLNSYKSVILSFDFDKEEFKIIELPPELQMAPFSVSKVGNLLSVNTVGVHGKTRCDIWVMLEYGVESSWCKIVNLDWEDEGLSNVMWVKEGGKEMIVSTNIGEVLLYDSSNRLAKSIGVLCRGDGCSADGFVPSLSLIENGTG